MKSKQIEYAWTGLFIGVIVGVMIGIGSMNMIKKSQRDLMKYYAVALSVIIFCSVGYSNGNRLGKEIDKEIELGIDKMEEGIYQQGRVWVAITKWTNKKSNIEYQLITGQTDEKVLITQLNDEVVFNHEIKSGSNENVTKYHKWARNEIFKQQKQLL